MLLRHTLSRQLWPPCLSWVSPINAVEHVGELRAGDLQATVGWRGPDKATSLQALGVERHADSVVPDDLHQVCAAATEDVEIAAMRVTTQRLLHLQRQGMHSTTHIGVADREPHPDAGWCRDHARNAANTRRRLAAVIVAVTRTAVPSGSTISIRSSGSLSRSAGPAD